MERIGGFVSLNYRLSEHPDYPQDPSKVEPNRLRVARHPDHINDVLMGMSALQQKYGFGSRYILVGHSCGATMALQSVMDLRETAVCRSSWTPPAAILGVDGIYDLPRLVEKFKGKLEYRESVVHAFGSNDDSWAGVSPARGTWLDKQLAWGREGTKLLVLAHSVDDNLVDWSQVEVMADKVQCAWGNPIVPRVDADSKETDAGPVDRSGNFALLDLRSAHHQVWESGWELARAIAFVLRGLERLEAGQVAFDEDVRFNQLRR